MNNLGMLHLELGELDKARAALERTLEGREKALGPTAADTLSTVHNLAVLSKEQGRYVEAKTLYERALRGREATLGADHADTVTPYNHNTAIQTTIKKNPETSSCNFPFHSPLLIKHELIPLSQSTVHRLGR